MHSKTFRLNQTSDILRSEKTFHRTKHQVFVLNSTRYACTAIFTHVGWQDKGTPCLRWNCGTQSQHNKLDLSPCPFVHCLHGGQEKTNKRHTGKCSSLKGHRTIIQLAGDVWLMGARALNRNRGFVTTGRPRYKETKETPPSLEHCFHPNKGNNVLTAGRVGLFPKFLWVYGKSNSRRKTFSFVLRIIQHPQVCLTTQTSAVATLSHDTLPTAWWDKQAVLQSSSSKALESN